MSHNDYERLHKIRYRWQNEQHLIRQKYRIPYNMTYTSRQCFSKPVSPTIQTENHNDPKRLDKHRVNIPPMYCSKCDLNLSECSCSNGLGQWWINLEEKFHSQGELNDSKSDSLHFNSSLIDLSSIERTKSNQYVLLNWNNPQSLLDFLRTIKFHKNLSSNLTIEQLRELITNNNHIHLFHSIIDLILFINKQQISLCQIYIDPTYYSTIQDAFPLSQSRLIADNTNLNRTLNSIQNISSQLGVKINQSMNEFLEKRISTNQRKLILHRQSLFIASKIPYNTFL